MAHKTICTASLTSLGSDPSKPSYLFASIFRASLLNGREVLPDYNSIIKDQKDNSGFANLMSYGLWSRLNWKPQLNFTSKRDVTYFPIPLKVSDNYDLDIPKYKTAFMKVFGQQPTKLIKALKDSKNDKEFTHISIVFGVPANTKDKYMLSILFNILNNCIKENITDLTYDADPKYEQLYRCRLDQIPTYSSGSGTLEGHKKDDCWIEVTKDTITLTRQNKDSWEKLTNFMIYGNRDIHAVRGENETKELNWFIENTKSTTGLYIPISFEDIKTNQSLIKVSPLSNLSQLMITNVKIIDIPWYMSSIFKYLLILIVIIIEAAIEVSTLGTATPAVVASDSILTGTLTVGITAVLGSLLSTAMISAVATALTNYILSTVITEVVKDTLKPLLGKKIAGYLGALSGLVGGSLATFGGKLATDPMSLIGDALNFTNSTKDFVVSESMGNIQKKQERLDEWKYMSQQEINSAYTNTGIQRMDSSTLNPILESPASNFAFSQPNNVLQAGLITGYDIVEMQMNQIRDHYKNGTNSEIF